MNNVNTLNTPDETPTVLATLHELRGREQQKMGWVSPRFTISRKVTLEQQVLEKNRCIVSDAVAHEVDAYRILRAQIARRLEEGEGKTIMVTSAVPGEGKTLTSINLAMTFARQFSQTALLVDCDLRRQMVHKVLGYQSANGLGDYFFAHRPLADLIVWPAIEKLTVISGGMTVTESSEVFSSPGMKALVKEMKHRYPERVVLFDAPAILDGADAIALAPLVDGIVVVTRAEHTAGRDVQKALRLLPQEKILGFVLNGVKRSTSGA